MTDQQIQIMSKELAQRALRFPNDINGNPRYYLPVYAFTKNGRFYRPRGAQKYRGKRFGPGWIFTSYDLESDLQFALENN